MKLSRKNRPVGDVDVAAFSDLAFLLIIFFVLTTTFVHRMGTKTTIPSNTSDPERKPEEEQPAIHLSMEHILLNEAEVTFAELRKKLQDLKLPEREEEKRAVVLESAPDVSFDRYFKVVTAISHAGGVLALIERQEAQGGAP